ncbi:MAG TPA: PQQ-binding-like beta-propeller repeat protein, partial [Urbifossiella sp.]
AAAEAAGPAVREVVWSPDADAPVPPSSKPKPIRPEPKREEEPEYEPEPEEEEVEFVRKRKKKKNRAPIILIGMCIAIVITVGVIVASMMQREKNSEEQESAEAQKQYADAKYDVAVKSYRTLAEKYPGSNAEKYRFFADLSEMRKNVALVTSFEEPRKALDSMRGFIEKHKASPLAKPDPYGQDVFAAGRQLLEDVKKNADLHVQAFMADRRTKVDELKKADDILALGLEFVPLLKDFRTKEDTHSLDSLREPLKEVQVAIGKQRKRLEILAQGRALVETPTDQAIQDAKSLFSSNGFDDDETQEIIRNAEANFLKAIRFEREPANPQAPPAPAAKSLLFVAPIGATKPANRGLDDHPTVFLAIARGVLYALDEDDGKLLWAARVGPDVFDPPTIAQVQLAEGPTDLALVTSNVAGHPAITAYVLRTGQPKWSQPLTPKAAAGVDVEKLPPAPAAGAAAVIGSRAYVSVRDAAGSVLVFDIATGSKIGRITIGQTISPGAIARPGTAQLYVAAESRRLFVFDVEAVASGGEPQCVRVIPTDHPTGSLRTIPIILGQPGDDPSPRFLVLSQSDGKGMKIRAFPLPATPSIAPDAPPLLEPLGTPVELSLNGWAWFPPVSDSERLTVVTDRNQFRIFGINQPGNEDAALFPLPFPTIPEPPRDEAIRGLVVPAEEGAYWVLIGGSLKKFRLTLLPDRGLTLV